MMPGGFGTCDEFMEILTLKQTGKISKPMPIVLFGTDYWNKLINFDEFVKNGTISRKDLKLFKPTNSFILGNTSSQYSTCVLNCLCRDSK